MANDIGYDSKISLPNKLLQDNGTVTDITGKEVTASVEVYTNKPALPNKFLNPDGSYSTLNEIIASMVDTSIFVIVDELPDSGDPEKIYLLPDGKGGFTEYHWTGSDWDIIGSVEIDLSSYSTTEEMNTAIASALSTAETYADTNFLKKNNTAVYTPSGDYHPATKKYVDDSITNNITNVLGGEY